uniref:Uncharacterized protein n=1 Tax=Arundo donax TaxID=35708 RepID=A0A0A9GTD9_ARUDO
MRLQPIKNTCRTYLLNHRQLHHRDLQLSFNLSSFSFH